MKLEYIITCEHASADESGRLTIQQSFDIVKTPGFPAIQQFMSIVTKWSFEKDDSKRKGHTQKIEIIGPDGNIIAGPYEVTLKAKDKSHSKYLQFINNIQNLPFIKPGTYTIKATMDGEEKENSYISIDAQIEA